MRIVADQVVPALLRACGRQPGAERGAGELLLTVREREVLQWIKEGKSSWEIAAILGISQDTVKFHLKKVYTKLNAGNRSQAIAVALERKLIE
jgi:DNA-binding CsgD family transcriptional regulator